MTYAPVKLETLFWHNTNYFLKNNYNVKKCWFLEETDASKYSNYSTLLEIIIMYTILKMILEVINWNFTADGVVICYYVTTNIAKFFTI